MILPALRTDRLLLRPFTREDIPDLVPLIGAREIAATTRRIPHPYTLADAEQFISTSQQSDEINLAILRQEDLRLVGGGILRPDADHQNAEVGYWIGVPYWSRGYATEAARALVQYAFDGLNLHRVYASHVANNPASGTVLRKIGMMHEGRMREHLVKWGEYQDLDFYGMLKGDPQAVVL